MLRKFRQLVPVIAAAAAIVVPASLASAQAPTLQEQLLAQYKLVKMGSDTSGYSVVEAGTLLAIEQGGILGVPYSDTNSVPPTKFENGTVHTPSSLVTKGIGLGMKKFGKEQTTHLFAKGNKVYPSKVDVNVAKDTVTMGIVACDTCNNTDPPTYNKAQVVFQFPKGSLAKASAGEVEDVIGKLFTISNDDSQQQGQGGQQQGGDQGGGGQAQGQQQAEQPQAEPVNIEKGMTPDQVEAAMGKPEKKVTLGPKQIYYYKDMKVIFVGGKVSDVQ